MAEAEGLADRPGAVSQALIDSAFFGPAQQYVRWDTGLHEVFEQAVQDLGGAHAAKPAVIRDRMGIALLTTAQVKSHLQKYRIRVVAEGKAPANATEAQARAAAKLLARQRRGGADSAAGPPKRREQVPIRGSRQASAAMSTGGLSGGAAGGAKRSGGASRGAGRKRRKTGRGVSAWSDEEEDELAEAALEETDEEEEEEPLSESDADVNALEGSGGEGRSARTTTGSPNGRGAGRHQLSAAEQREALPFEKLAGQLGGKGVAVDVATVTGLAARRDGLVAAAAAAAADLLSGGSGETQQAPSGQLTAGPRQLMMQGGAPTVGGDLDGICGTSNSSIISTSSAAAALQRQAQLEQALLEQSIWVQRLAAEVQDLRVRQQLGLPPPGPSAPDNGAYSSPFAALAQAAFPGPAPDGSAASNAMAFGMGQQQQQQQQKSSTTMATCDSTLLRLLSNTLGQGSWMPNDPMLAAAAAAAAAWPQQQQQPMAPPPLPQQQQQQQQPNGSSMMTCDSALLHMLSRSLRDSMPPPQVAQDPTAALLQSMQGMQGFDMQAAIAAAAAAVAASSAGAFSGGGLMPPPSTNASPFAAFATQALPPLQPAAGGRGGQQAPPPGGGRQASLDAFNSGLLSLGLGGAAPGTAPSLGLAGAAEFLRLCSLPLGGDLLPQPPAE